MATSYSNIGGSGDRRTPIIATTTKTFSAGSISGLVDGVTAAGVYWSTQAVSGLYLQFDFRYPAIIDEATFTQSSTSSHGVWRWQGSDNGSDWTNIGDSFTLGGATSQTQTSLNGNSTSYRYYRLLGVSGNASNAPWLYEFTFKIDYNTSGTTPAYGNAGGIGDRTGIITVSGDVGHSGSYNGLIDGLYTNVFSLSAASIVDKYITFDFGSLKLIKEALWYQSSTPSHGTWQWQGSNDDSNWSNIGNTFTLGGSLAQVHTELNGNTTGYRYYRLLGISGSGNDGPFILELDFLIGVGSAVRDLVTVCAATSTISTPLAAIARELFSDPATVSTLSGPQLGLGRELQSNMAVGSVLSIPLLAVLRELISAIPVVSDTGPPVLAVERQLTSDLNVVSTLSTPNLKVQRLLATLAEVLSATSDINLILHSILDLTTVIAAQSLVSNIDLQVLRTLNSSIMGQSQISTPILVILRELATAVGAETQCPSIVLQILRDLATAIACESATSIPTLDIIDYLTTTILATTNVSNAETRVIRELITTIEAQSSLPDIDMKPGLTLDLVTTIVALSLTADLELLLDFHESLRAKALRWLGTEPITDLREKAVLWVAEEENREENQ